LRKEKGGAFQLFDRCSDGKNSSARVREKRRPGRNGAEKYPTEGAKEIGLLRRGRKRDVTKGMVKSEKY